MWKHLRERFHTVKVRVLHPRIPKSSSVDILRGVLLFLGFLWADLIHELKLQLPNATITHNGVVRWIGGIFYVDDLCLISTDTRELQMMINKYWMGTEIGRLRLGGNGFRGTGTAGDGSNQKGGKMGAGYVNLRKQRKRQRRWDAKRKDRARTVRN